MTRQKKKIPLHLWIVIAMLAGVVWGMIAIFGGLGEFTTDWVKPFGTIFIKMLKLIAVPLVLVSLIDGISNLSDLTKLSRIGGKTIGFYLFTTVVAITIGLLLVNTIQPGKFLPGDKREELRMKYASDANLKMTSAKGVEESGPLQMLEDIVPDNFFKAATDNGAMLQVIFFAFMLGIAMVMSPKDKLEPVKGFFEGINITLLNVVHIIMKYAPIGVFALIAGLLVDIAGDDPSGAVDLFKALGVYALTVLGGLGTMIFLIYPLFIRIFTKIKYVQFIKGIFPAQMLAFTTSSSAATLPVTMDCVEKNLGVSEEVTSFVLPLGATINMDGTSIHQAVSAVFIAQAFGHDLTLADQLIIVLTATLSSIGAAAVPSAGLIMLVIVLGAIGVEPEGLALIIAIDRPLDMVRTIVNVTGDASVAVIVAASEGDLASEFDKGLLNSDTVS
ncbi:MULTISPECIES: dicarboxylate/amino acid:cation symporter [unclassified Imperialibacter]|uniref:dicarboxylate/amino acid:cation symporter n=1 Tax=unclassified Imperialibacter TaxID=2629706 RepID=UPI001259B843|nr:MULTISPECIES: dicarboxylate/amino acid:cation symporter [unclassified Imperialibacter]CAD5291324.1 Dicarboxylate/amino acid:cation symporter [Imperialibacter sp. 89]CAD5291545.1 Dicarboxylate/amino acid:cation symporter [Imperialibacter sp. 75]VVT34370.1 Dicarboxylate/amino acid:cation symporter [Imperialibacter sp. EC-SDR9]